MDTIDEFREENTRLGAALAQVEAENSQLKSDCARQNNAIIKLETDVVQARDEVGHLSNENAQLKNNLAQAANEAQQLSNENAQLKNDLTQADNEVQQLNAQKGLLTSEVQQLNTQKGQLTRENDRLGAASIVANHELGKLRGELTQATNDVKRLTVAAEEEVPAARKDLIRRFVAIAISVGFASQLVKMNVIDSWVEAIKQWPSWWPLWTTIPNVDVALLETMFRLATSMIVILLGWDWYDRDLKSKPLTRIDRFILDAIIVSAELVLLLSSSHPQLWAIVLVVIFGLYIVWDMFSIIDHPDAFGFPVERAKWWYAPWNILCTYGGGLAGDQRKRGPPINLTWFAYFVVVLVVLPWFWPIRMYGGFVTCLMVILGASLLWCEGVFRSDGRTRLISFSGRLVAFALLAILYWLLWKWLT